MTNDYAKYEGLVSGDGSEFWNQSYYYQFYDPATRCGALIRIGLQENRQEANSWLIVFQDGLPLFTRTNMNLPYTPDRPLNGVTLAGMHIHAEIPLKRTRITFGSPDFTLDLAWDELQPLEDCVAMSNDEDGSFARELAHIHLEGTSTVTGHIMHRGVRIDINGKGFRDIAAGPRNWDALLHYRLVWPVFENGMAFAGVHGISTKGQSSYLRMIHDGDQWRRVAKIDDQVTFAPNRTSAIAAKWTFVDELDRTFEITGTSLFTWLFPLDTFVLCEQLMEYKLADGTVGYGLFETGYRLPWKGLD